VPRHIDAALVGDPRTDAGTVKAGQRAGRPGARAFRLIGAAQPPG
jgi:hypothetical protein